MGLVNRGGTPPQILIGPSATDPEFDDLVGALRSDGCDVHIFDDIPIEVPIPKRGSALFVVTQRDTVDTADGQRVQGLIREAGYVEGQLGRSQVLLLVDESAPRLSDTGLEQIRYPAGNLEAVHAAVATRLGLSSPPPPTADSGRADRDLHRQEPIREQFRSADLKVPWMLVAVIVFVSVLAGALFFRNLFGGDGGNQVAADDSASTTQPGPAESDSEAEAGQDPAGPASAGDRSSGQLGGLTADVDGGDDGRSEATATTYVTFAPSTSPGAVLTTRRGATSAPPSTAASRATTRSTTTGRASTTQPPPTTAAATTRASQPPPPTASSAPAGAGSASIPATCYLDLRKGQLVARELLCDGAGALEVGGWAGPWHNDVYALALGVGTSGTLTYELQPGQSTPTVVPLSTGVFYLDEAAARFGVHHIAITFSGADQHFHIIQRADRGGAEALLVFVLDVP